jgi:hypothetical protein
MMNKAAGYQATAVTRQIVAWKACEQPGDQGKRRICAAIASSLDSDTSSTDSEEAFMMD